MKNRFDRHARTPAEGSVTRPAAAWGVALWRLIRRRGGPSGVSSFDFDRLARDVSLGLSRREALRRLGGGIAGGLLAALGLEKAWAQGVCPPGLTLCGPVCVDRRTDPGHCGACDHPCAPGQSCVNGQCVCPEGHLLCGGICVNRFTDPNHCGQCGRQCLTGQSCVSGQCICPEGHIVCGGQCVNRRSDPNHCGGCGRVCAPGTICVSGQCVTGCSSGTSLCGGPLGSACCAAGLLCCNGTCCAGNATCCNDGCYPTGFHCCAEGSACRSDYTCCGRACCAPGRVCDDGQCRAACPPGELLCGGRCIDVLSDFNNCGACGRICFFDDLPGPARSACCNGVCCIHEQVCCFGACANLIEDSNNCGACGRVCPIGTSCEGGQCI